MISKRVKPGETVFFAVEGAGSFPIDMLRYDACWPATEEDAGLVQQDAYSDPKPMRRVVLACKPGDNWRSTPTVGRWQSFTWRAGPLRESRYD